MGQESLWTPEGTRALDYLTRERRISETVIKQFRIGYCPAGSHHELAGRIIMPLFDSYGEVVAITSRNPWIEKRWQHWHESFDKDEWLFGLDVAKQHIRRTDKALIVEGQTDTFACHTHGFNMTVGMLGSALSIVQIAQLARYCSEVYMLSDPDESGEGCSARAKEMFETYQLHNYRFLFVPVPLPKREDIKMDPDNFLKNLGGKALIDLLRRSKEKVVNG
jgi:DNA primase